MKTSILSNTDNKFDGANYAVTLDYADVAAATSGVAINLFSILAGTKVQCVGMKLNTAFDITGTGALALTVGDGDAANSLLASTVVAVDGTEILYSAGGSAKAYTANDTVDAFFTDATSMAYTSGSVTLYFRITDLTALPVP